MLYYPEGGGGAYIFGAPVSRVILTKRIDHPKRSVLDRQSSIEVTALGSVVRRSLNTRPLYTWELNIKETNYNDLDSWALWFEWQEAQSRAGANPSIAFADLTTSIVEQMPISRVNYDPSKVSDMGGFLSYFPEFRVILSDPPDVNYNNIITTVSLNLIEYA